MYDPSHLFDYVTHARDRARLFVNPMLVMPFEGPLPPLPIGHRRYVAAADGIYLQSCNRALAVTLRFAATPALPFGRLHEEVRMAGGPVPQSLLDQMQQAALAHHPSEWAALVHWDEANQHYVLTTPTAVGKSSSHITYSTEALDIERLVLNVHSHGPWPARFSAQDDLSDQHGLYFASVFGHCESEDSLTVTTRIVADGYHHPIPWHPWSTA
jgi:PRTRC genetic system protein A